VATAFFRIAPRGCCSLHRGRVKIVTLDAYTANPGWAALGQRRCDLSRRDYVL